MSYQITTTEILDSDSSLDLVCNSSYIEAGETVEITDGNGYNYTVKKPIVKHTLLVADYSEDFDIQNWWWKKEGYDVLTGNQVLMIANEVEFDVWSLENKFKKRYYVRDSQQANLGGIESEVFTTLREVAERLETYYFDYLGEEEEEEVF
jgi:hypothetical protein